MSLFGWSPHSKARTTNRPGFRMTPVELVRQRHADGYRRVRDKTDRAIADVGVLLDEIECLKQADIDRLAWALVEDPGSLQRQDDLRAALAAP